MPKEMFPQTTAQLAATRQQLAPDSHEAFTSFSERARSALRHGASSEEIMEAIWVAAEMRAGGAYAHSALALDTIDEMKGRQEP